MKKYLSTIAIILSMAIPQFAHADIMTGLEGWWKFDEGVGSTANDSSGNGNTGTLVNTPTWVAGKIGPYALNFASASSQDVTVADSASLDPSAITISAWVNGTSFPNGYNAIVQKGNGSSFIEYFVKSDGKMAVYITCGSGNIAFDDIGTHTLSAGTWYMVTFTYDSTNGLVVYVNGASDGTYGAMGTPFSTSGISLGIANDLFTAGRYFNGSVDDVRVYNRALSSSDVTQLYAYTGINYQFQNFVAHLKNVFKVLKGAVFSIQ